MTLLEAIYGSQYQEISQRGGDGSKGRFNGNLLISVIFLLLLLTVIFVLMLIPYQNIIFYFQTCQKNSLKQ